MTKRKEILSAIRLYCEKKYDIQTFCDEFGLLYAYTFFSEDEQAVLDKILFITERCSDSDEDLKMYPNVYFSKDDAKVKIDEILRTQTLLKISAVD